MFCSSYLGLRAMGEATESVAVSRMASETFIFAVLRMMFVEMCVCVCKLSLLDSYMPIVVVNPNGK